MARVIVLLKDKAIATGNPRPDNRLEDLLIIYLEVHLPVNIQGNLIPVEAIFKAIIAYGSPRIEALLLLIKGLLGLYLLHKAVWAASFPGASADINTPLRAIAKVRLIRESKGMPVLFL